MAVCLECKADYIRGITVCPACNRPLEPDPEPEPVESVGFVPFLTASYPEGMAAAASLEAAGLETRLATQDFHIYLAAPLYVTVLVRERDLDAASVVLRRPPPPPAPPPERHPCVICGTTATVHESERRGRVVATTDYCEAHASNPVFLASCDAAAGVDEDVREAVAALNALKDVRTVCSCSGSHSGAGEGFISLAPAAEDPASTARFDSFIELLQKEVSASDLSPRVVVEWSAVHGAEINLTGRAQVRETWAGLARLVAAQRMRNRDA